MEVTSSRVSGWNRNKSFTIYRNELGHRVENEATEKGAQLPRGRIVFYKCATNPRFVTERDEKEIVNYRVSSYLPLPPPFRETLVRRSMNENPFTATGNEAKPVLK